MPIPYALRNEMDPDMSIVHDYTVPTSQHITGLGLCISMEGKVLLFDLGKGGRFVRELLLPSEARSPFFMGTSGQYPRLLQSGSIAVAFTPSGSEVRLWHWPSAFHPAQLVVEQERDVLEVAVSPDQILLGLRLPHHVRGRRRALLKLWRLQGSQVCGPPSVAPLSRVEVSGTGESEITALVICKDYCVAATSGHHLEVFSLAGGLVSLWRLCAEAELLALPEGFSQVLTTAKCPAVQTAFDIQTGATLDVRRFPDVGPRMQAFASSADGRLLAARPQLLDGSMASRFPQLWVACMDTAEPEVRCAIQAQTSKLHILGELIAGVVDNGALVRAWMTRTGRVVAELQSESVLTDVVLLHQVLSD
eukprot:gnl/MRDRNA2_/MRDRNA2_220588_c0_seq1.p1 gnl/MRDRNA2_/MRDRNA2_220588_c0~~gnl/MRDRNA2_/MRDRNA2_220588_c0_seq1.p1  ORF type:complete len:363 (-),score=41.52 gnl/MRDRNA2_/MRDRNA2_220588_c0_seq1:110-1198(-)